MLALTLLLESTRPAAAMTLTAIPDVGPSHEVKDLTPISPPADACKALRGMRNGGDSRIPQQKRRQFRVLESRSNANSKLATFRHDQAGKLREKAGTLETGKQQIRLLKRAERLDKAGDRREARAQTLAETGQKRLREAETRLDLKSDYLEARSQCHKQRAAAFDESAKALLAAADLLGEDPMAAVLRRRAKALTAKGDQQEAAAAKRQEQADLLDEGYALPEQQRVKSLRSGNLKLAAKKQAAEQLADEKEALAAQLLVQVQALIAEKKYGEADKLMDKVLAARRQARLGDRRAESLGRQLERREGILERLDIPDPSPVGDADPPPPPGGSVPIGS